ncbi:tetraspanin-18-like [Coffea eugenioides]|uniref:tetraspanin-18-like n=1 Tax=Coffea eugenioides TaxID=49369 RepID=UPI000F60AFF6|nr:tetraspanin-18-like [Coffea eugenioides]
MARGERTCCQSFLAVLLKFLNYLQTFLGVSIIIYASLMLNHWYHHHTSVPSTPPPPPHSSHPGLSPSHFSYNLHNLDLHFPADVVLDAGLLNGLQFNSNSLPKPWFIYAFLGVGILMCCITCIGHIAAEAINGCCLCFYAILSTFFILLEVSLVTFIAIDRQWETDLPVDSTGELDHLRTFLEENRDVFEWVGIAVVIIQVMSLLLSLILRALVNQKEDLDNERVYDIRERPWEPLLHPHLSQASGSIRSDGRGSHSDIWSSRMREKYGLNGGDDKQNIVDQNSSVEQNPRN